MDGLIFPRVVLFDWDNTLVDSWTCIRRAMNETLKAMGHEPWNLDDTKDRVALSLRDSFPTLFGDRWTEARTVFYEKFEAIHFEYLRPLPGVVDMLDRLKTLGLGLGVISNKNGNYLREEIAHLGWEKRFQSVVGANDAARDKPDAASVDRVLSPMGCGAGPRVWLVGDAEVDMQCAIGTGCIPVLLRKDPPRDGEFDRYRPRLIFTSCDDLGASVRELLVSISRD